MGKRARKRREQEYKATRFEGETMKQWKSRRNGGFSGLIPAVPLKAIAKAVATPKTAEKPVLASVSGDLEALTVPELRSIAKSMSLRGYSTMRKEELLAALQ